MAILTSRDPGESRDLYAQPGASFGTGRMWVPASAGMTIHCEERF